MKSKMKPLMSIIPFMAIMGTEYFKESFFDDKKSESQMFKNPSPIPKGHKKFIIEGKEVWALNYKNALKKVKKI